MKPAMEDVARIFWLLAIFPQPSMMHSRKLFKTEIANEAQIIIQGVNHVRSFECVEKIYDPMINTPGRITAALLAIRRWTD